MKKCRRSQAAQHSAIWTPFRHPAQHAGQPVLSRGMEAFGPSRRPFSWRGTTACHRERGRLPHGRHRLFPSSPGGSPPRLRPPCHYDHTVSDTAFGMHESTSLIRDHPQARRVEGRLTESQHSLGIRYQEVRGEIGIAIGFPRHDQSIPHRWRQEDNCLKDLTVRGDVAVSTKYTFRAVRFVAPLRSHR